MKYERTVKGIFVDRPNRFIAHVEIDGEVRVCHVKNTGRCRELLIPGATVILEKSDNPSRKTAYDLVAVYKGRELINMDSQAPNAVFGEWLKSSDYFGKLTYIKPEYTYGNSRFDFYLEAGERKIFVEVKGVTLENNGEVTFPDAPTERGVKHLEELIEAKKAGFESYIFFVIQMQNCAFFAPNEEIHSEFASVLYKAAQSGVEVRAVNCRVEEDFLEIDGFVECKLKN